MNQRVLFVWAMAASLIAVGTSGYIIGKRAGDEPVTADVARPVSDQPYTTEPGAAREPLPEYVVPEQFAGGPREWRSPDSADLSGYVALFDPASRELLVEQCRHSGYPIDENGRPGQPAQQFCTRVLTGRFQSWSDQGAVVVDRDGRTVEVALTARFDSDESELGLTFDEHRATLVPGSKNDLLQAMEKEPEIVEQKRRYLIAMNSRPEPDERDGRTEDRKTQ